VAQFPASLEISDVKYWMFRGFISKLE